MGITSPKLILSLNLVISSCLKGKHICSLIILLPPHPPLAQFQWMALCLVSQTLELQLDFPSLNCLRLVFSSLVMTNHMWPFKITYVKYSEKIQYSSCPGHMSSTQQLCGANSYCIGHCRYRTSLLVQEVPLDRAAWKLVLSQEV